MTSDCVVDIQSFKISNKKGEIRWAVKELGIYNGKISYHYIFKPPFPFHQLSTELQKEANWVMNFHHGIPWDDGYVSLEDFPKILEGATKTAGIIFVKGNQKAEFLKKYINKPIMELPEQPKLKPTIPECWNHKLDSCACALANAYKLYNLYLEYVK
jgi:hypothetical protein